MVLLFITFIEILESLYYTFSKVTVTQYTYKILSGISYLEKRQKTTIILVFNGYFLEIILKHLKLFLLCFCFIYIIYLYIYTNFIFLFYLGFPPYKRMLLNLQSALYTPQHTVHQQTQFRGWFSRPSLKYILADPVQNIVKQTQFRIWFSRPSLEYS